MSEVHTFCDGVIQVNVPHDTVVYTSIIAENHAGLRSVFYAESIRVDATAPVFLNTPSLSIEGMLGASKDAHVDWEVADKESNIQLCHCAIGKHRRYKYSYLRRVL